MTGRFYENDDWDDIWSLMAYGRWIANNKTIWRSKRGKKMLTEMKSALLALPEHKLISGWLVKPPEKRSGLKKIFDLIKPKKTPQVCALGAFGLYKGANMTAYYPSPEAIKENYNEDDQYESLNLAQSYGMTQHMAWEIGNYNDSLNHLSPEELWERMYQAITEAEKTGIWINY
jgi:hypothetical protein